MSKDDIYVCEINLSVVYDKKSKKIKYPEITKDVAFILDKNVLSSDVEKEIRRNGNKILSSIKVFDLYVGDKIDKNKKSVGYSLTFQDVNRTLTDEEVDSVFKTIIDKVSSKFKCEIRDK